MKTRIAPSPTGKFHLGTLRTALLNYLLARANNGQFILRIDDTDVERNSDEDIQFIYEQLSYFGLEYDYTFKQSDNLPRYFEVANKIGILQEDNSIIIKMDSYDMTILRSNGYPTYNFSSIVDDYDNDITHIIRGVDHIQNLPKQKIIWDMLCDNYGSKNFPEIKHAGLLFEGASKLSKRSGNGTTDDYNSFNKNAILNWLLKFGWSHPNPNFDSIYPILTINDMINLFNEGHIKDSNCKIDKMKLQWLNKKHNNLNCEQDQ